ncbi:unnamed protein product [Symbiodinium pilosum]|uniref:Uncharacterized protein n=1 Tax=Symbiodinium pilosum TaxID=2952 RepID=A0A812TEA4_SYMPI|nr:unnamed protein product [Symbiodinium pilosum]
MSSSNSFILQHRSCGARRSCGSPLLGVGELSLSPRRLRRAGDVDGRNDCELAPADDVGMPRRRLSEWSAKMQSSSGVREALSHSPAPRFLRERQGVRRSLTATRIPEGVLSGCGERQAPPRRLLQVRGDSKEFAERGRSSSGIPWRVLPLYDCHGILLQTGSLLEPQQALRAPTVFSEALRSSEVVKDLLFGDTSLGHAASSPRQRTPRTSWWSPQSPQSQQRWQGSASRRNADCHRELAPVRASDHAMEAERSRCLAKLDRLCAQTPRVGRAGTRAADSSACGHDPKVEESTSRTARSGAPPSSCAGEMSPRHTASSAEESLRCTKPQSQSRRTYSFEAEMAKISVAAGRITSSSAHSPRPSSARPACRSSFSITAKEKALEDSRRRSPPRKKQLQAACLQSPSEELKHYDLHKPLGANASTAQVGKVVELIDKIIGHDRGQPLSQPESEGRLSPTPEQAQVSPRSVDKVIHMIDSLKKENCRPRQEMLLQKAAGAVSHEPEPEVDTASPSQHASPYPRLLASAVGRDKADVPAPRSAMVHKEQAVQKGKVEKQQKAIDKVSRARKMAGQVRSQKEKFTAVLQS